MGIDVTIYFQALKPDFNLERALLHDFTIEPIADYKKEDHQGATHQVHTMMRYYGDGYERGDWGAICRVLMLLHASLDIGTVWYGGDSSNRIPKCSPDDVLNLCSWYMANGERPYRDYFNR